MKKIFISALFFASQVFAADTVLNTNKVKVGQQTSSADKVIEFNTNSGAANPKIKVSPSTNKIQFSNDGTNFKDIGSGSGGGAGINLLAEPGFESGVTVGWSNTGGTFANVTTAPNLLFGTTSAAFTSSAAGQYFESTSISIPEILKGQDCYVKVEYKGADSNYFLTVTDGTGTEIIPTNARATLSTATLKRDAKVYFTCPTTGSLKLRVQSTALGAIGYFDQASLGQSDAVPFKQSQVYGTARWAAATNCVWPMNNTGVGTAGSFLTASVDTDCNNPVITGNVLAPLTKLPSVRLSNAPAGSYKVTINGNFNIDANSALFSIYDGVSQIGSARAGVNVTTNFVGTNQMTSIFRYTSNQPLLQFQPVVNVTAGSPNTTINNSENTQDETAYEIIVEYYPLESDIVSNAKCLNPVDCENDFSMSITNTGTGANSENLDWINGNCSWGGGSWVCNFNAGVFSNAPICTTSLTFSPVNNGFASINAITSSSITIQVAENGASVQKAFNLRCQKQLTDFKPKQEIKAYFSSALNPVAFYASGNASQSIPNVTTTQVIVSNEAYDTANAYNPTTGVFSVPENGKYQCSCQVGIVGVPAGAFTIVSYVMKNGSSVSEKWETTAGSNVYMPLAVGYESYVVGDQITCRTNQNTGASRTVDPNGPRTFFACNKVAN